MKQPEYLMKSSLAFDIARPFLNYYFRDRIVEQASGEEKLPGLLRPNVAECTDAGLPVWIHTINGCKEWLLGVVCNGKDAPPHGSVHVRYFASFGGVCCKGNLH